MEIVQSRKLSGVAYDVRGPVLEEALRLEREGHTIVKLNIGNPAPFGFEGPDDLLRDVIGNLPAAVGYGDSRGLLSAREAIVNDYRSRGVEDIDVTDVYVGNGVSELIQMALQALLDDGDEVLIPAPDYPLWTAVTTLCGGRPLYYRCDEESGWLPDLADVEARVTPRTRALVVINPNNPTGAVYPPELLRGLADIAARHGLVLFADEIYDRILYDDAVHTVAASLAPDVLCVTMSGLSKSSRLAGFRCGWAVVSGPRDHAQSYLEGLTVLANMRLCPNVPAQHAIAAALESSRVHRQDLVLPGGRLLAQRDRSWELLNAIPGVSCIKPKGALYAFPRIDPAVHLIHNDEQMALDLLRAEHVLIAHGSAFNILTTDHFRLVTLPAVADLEDAIARIGRFLAVYEQ